MPQNVMLVIMPKIASIQDVIKKHLPIFTSIDAIILSSVNPMTLCNLEKVVREQSLTTITINIPCSQEPLQELVLSIVEMPTCIHTTDNNQIARGEWMPRSTVSSSNLNLRHLSEEIPNLQQNASICFMSSSECQLISHSTSLPIASLILSK